MSGLQDDPDYMEIRGFERIKIWEALRWKIIPLPRNIKSVIFIHLHHARRRFSQLVMTHVMLDCFYLGSLQVKS